LEEEKHSKMHWNKTLGALGVILHALDVQNSTERHCLLPNVHKKKKHFAVFHCGFEEKSQFFSPNSLGNQPINKENTRSIKGRVFPQILALEYGKH